MKHLFTKIIIFIALLLSQSTAFAQIIDSSFYQWTVYEIEGDELQEKKCYMVAHPIKSETDNEARQKPYVIITRYQNRRIEEVGVNAGFEYKENGKVLLSIDDVKFQLYSNHEMAWAKNKNDDVALIQKLLHSSVLKVRADSAIGNFAVDEYSLKGITKAYSRVREICK